jgi:hypothetical protein
MRFLAHFESEKKPNSETSSEGQNSYDRRDPARCLPRCAEESAYGVNQSIKVYADYASVC